LVPFQSRKTKSLLYGQEKLQADKKASASLPHGDEVKILKGLDNNYVQTIVNQNAYNVS